MLKHWKKATLIVALCAVMAVPAIINVASTGQNIAPDATVQSECPNWALASLGPEKMVDNNKTNFSTSTYVNSADTVKDIYLTFDKTYKVDEVKLYPRVASEAYAGGFPKDFTVSLWNGTTWVEVASRKNYSATAEALTLTFDECDYRALRIHATKLDNVDGGAQFGLQLAEIEVYSKTASTTIAEPTIYMNAINVAQESTVNAECPNWAMANMGPEKMVDGNKTNFSTSTYVDNLDVIKDVYLTFDGTYSVNEIVLYPRSSNGEYAGGFPKDFTVSLWNGTTWVEVISKTNYNATADALNITFVAEEYRAMRIHVTELDHVDDGTKYGLQLAEIEVKGVASTGTIEAPTILLGASNVAMAAEIESECPTWALANLGPEKMIDGNKTNFSTSTYVDSADTNKEIQLVLDAAYKINEVILYPRTSNGAYAGGVPKDFTVSLWNGTEWIEVASKTGYVSNSNGLVLNFAAGDYRAVRISASELDIVDGGPKFGLQLAEIEVYGVQASGDVAAPPTNDQGGGEEPENPVNIALNGEVVSECPAWALANLGPEKMIDGNTTNFSTSTYVDSEETTKEVYITFDKTYKVSEVSLYPRTAENAYAGGFPKDFTVSIWNGTKWIEVASKTDITANAEKMSITFEAVDARAILIKATKLDHVDSGTQFGLQLAEIEVYGVTSDENIEAPNIQLNPDEGGNEEDNTPANVALDADVVAECPSWAQASLGPKKMVDENFTNFSTSTYVDKADTVKEIYITFDKTYNVDEITLYPRVENGKYVGGFPENFTVCVWTGTEWKEVASKTGVSANTEKVSIAFNAIDARALRIRATKLSETEKAAQYALQFAEIAVNGVKATSVIAKPQVELPSQNGSENNSGAGSTNNDLYGGASNGALYGVVTAECPQWALASVGPEKLVDGNRTNFYTSSYVGTPRTTKEVYVTFEKTHSIHTITLYPRVENGKYVGGFPENFTVSVWTGKEWKQVGAKTGYKSGVSPLTFEFNTIICNGVRIQATRLSKTDDGSQFALQLAELEALGSESEVQLAAPVMTNEKELKVTIDNDKNIALNGPAKASSDWAQYGAGITNINDGDISSFFATDGNTYKDGDTEWAEINLLDNYSINTVILAARSKAWGFPYDFTISVFYDGKWTDVVTEKNFEADESNSITLYEFKFSPVIGNKVRISSNNFRKADNDKTFIIGEMAVYGTKAVGNYVIPNENMISTNTTIVTTTTMNDYGYYLNHLNDGDLKTEWSSVPTASASDEHIIEVDFKREVQIGEVQLKPSWGGNGFPVDFTISIFSDGQWVEVYSVTDYEKPIDEAIQRFSFEARRGTKFRITVTKQAAEGGLYVVKLNQIMAYPNATGNDFDDNKVEEINYEKVYEATENDVQKDTQAPKANIVHLFIGAVLMLCSVCGCILLIKVLDKREKITGKQ